MKNKSLEEIEKEFLSILFYKPEISFDLLQLKKEYFSNKIHQEIFSLIVDSFCRYGTIDNSFILDNLDPNIFDTYTNVITNDNLPVSQFKEHFSIAQDIILENYKKRVISTLTKKLNSKEITMSHYVDLVNRLDMLQVQKKGTKITVEELDDGIKQGKKIDLSFYPKLNRAIEFNETDLLVIGASTGTGKTSFMLNLFNGLMEKYRCLYLNMEVGKGTIYPRMIAIRGDIPVKDVKKPQSENQQKCIQDAKNKLSQKDIYVETKVFSISEIEDYIKLMKDENKHTIVFVDHLGWIRNDNKTKMSRYEITTFNIQSLRQMCLKHKVSMITACQLKRPDIDKKDKEYVPKKSDLRDSGEIEQSACSILLLSRKEGYSENCLTPKMLVQVAKNRDGIETGLTFEFTKIKQIFTEEVV